MQSLQCFICNMRMQTFPQEITLGEIPVEIIVRIKTIWRFPEIWVPPNHPFFDGIFHYKSTIVGIPHLRKPPYYHQFYNEVSQWLVSTQGANQVAPKSHVGYIWVSINGGPPVIIHVKGFLLTKTIHFGVPVF